MGAWQQACLRLSLLCVAPATALFLSDGGTLLALTCGSSVIAVVIDTLRQRKRCIPFPIFLLLVYATQVSFVVLNPVLVAPETITQSVVVGDAANPQHRNIQTISVVIAAHNEHKYMKRTLDSIYGSTPSDVLTEIIVVDDASTPPLASKLKDHPQVKVIRHEKRRGLIKSKTEGGNLATGDMIMFLDAHVKPYENWWGPFLRHMSLNYKRVVVPLIPTMDGDTWIPNDNAVGVKMMFDWTLFFQWFEDGNDLVPCMSGGLFGISREWWHESGEYDYGMQMWGAENIEQSIRIWLCGGEIYVARDSRISHVFRSAFPYEINNTEIYINKVRTVETWFGNYKERYYKADPAARQFVPYKGDISSRLELQKTLKCKPFDWYVDKFKKVFAEKHMLPEEVFLIRNTQTGLCLHTTEDHGVREVICNENFQNNNHQQWSLFNDGASIRNAGTNECFDANAGLEDKEGLPVFLYRCYDGNNAQQRWKLQNGHIRWDAGNFCIVGGASQPKLTLTRCSSEFLQRKGVYEVYQKQTVTGPGSL